MNIPCICDIQPQVLSVITGVVDILSHPLMTDWCTIHQSLAILKITMRASLTLILGSRMRLITDNT